MDEQKGRMFDVLVEIPKYPDPYTGLMKESRETIVWADDGNLETIRAVEGVEDVRQYGVKYYVDFDARYDKAFVIEEIKAAILCK